MADYTGSCLSILMNDFISIWSFVKSDKGHLLFLIAATTRAIFYYLVKSPLREARELANVITLTCLFGFAISVCETYPPKWMTQLATACVKTDYQVGPVKKAAAPRKAGVPML